MAPLRPPAGRSEPLSPVAASVVGCPLPSCAQPVGIASPRSSGAYGYTVGMSLALCYMKADTAKAGDRVSVAILGRPHSATILERPPFDPEGERLRM